MHPRADVRPGAEADLEGIAAVAAANDQGYEGAGGDARYVRHLLEVGRLRVAVVEGDVVGYAASRRIGDADMLCDLFVLPGLHGHGIGQALLGSVWSGVPHRLTFSSSHRAAAPLYMRAGMTPWWSLFYLFGDPSSVSAPPGTFVTMVTAEEATAVERELTGYDRRDDHQYWRGRPDGASFVVETATSGRAVAVVGGAGEEYGISHLVAEAPGAAPLLGVLQELRGPTLVRLPGPHAALPLLLRAGWRVGYVDLFMATDPGLLPADRCAPHPGLA